MFWQENSLTVALHSRYLKIVVVGGGLTMKIVLSCTKCNKAVTISDHYSEDDMWAYSEAHGWQPFDSEEEQGYW